jgi:hypothetical protein
MRTNNAAVFFGATLLTSAAIAGSGLSGCRSSTTPGGTGATTTTTSSSSSSSGASEGGPATVVSIDQVTNTMATGYVGPGTPVELQGVVATSIKFLVSHSKTSGSCLWGVFVSSPGLATATANSGVLAVSFGTPAVAGDAGGTAYCPTIQAGMQAGDAFPDDTAPGDVLDILGTTDAYIPASCTVGDAGLGASMVPGVQISKVTTATRKTQGGPVPKPYVLTSSDLATFAAGSDATWLNKWGGVLVEAQNVVAQSQAGALTDAYGHMLLQEGTNGIQVGDKLYYVGYVKGTDACYSGPSFPTAPPLTFTSITGFVYLDYCNWGIIPRDKCNDLQPPSDDCASVVDAGPDAAALDGGPSATVCTHEPTGATP